MDFCFVPFVPFCGKRKAREGGDSAVARFTGFMQFVLTKSWNLRRRLYPSPTFVGPHQGGTPAFSGTEPGPSATSWTLIIHGGRTTLVGPSPTSWTLMIHGGNAPFPGVPLPIPSPTSLPLIIMAVLLLSAYLFGNPSFALWL